MQGSGRCLPRARRRLRRGGGTAQREVVRLSAMCAQSEPRSITFASWPKCLQNLSRSSGEIWLVMSLRHGWTPIFLDAMSSLSRMRVTFASLSFITASGDTEPCRVGWAWGEGVGEGEGSPLLGLGVGVGRGLHGVAPAYGRAPAHAQAARLRDAGLAPQVAPPSSPHTAHDGSAPRRACTTPSISMSFSADAKRKLPCEERPTKPEIFLGSTWREARASKVGGGWRVAQMAGRRGGEGGTPPRGDGGLRRAP